MRVLIAGGTGVLGAATVPRLVEAGHEVVSVSRRDESDVRLRAVGAAPVRLDVFDAAAVAAMVASVEAVINIATHIPSPPRALAQRAWRTNDRLRSEAAGHFADAAVRHGVRFVQESFAPTYADGGDDWIDERHPLDPVAQTRTVPVAEDHAERVTSSGSVGVVLRFGFFYGAGSPDTRAWVDTARKGRLMLPGPAEAFTSMIHVHDAAAAVVAALSVPAGVYNVVEDQPLRRADHAEILAELVGRDRLNLLPESLGRIPALKVARRSHRISNRKLREGSAWRPAAPTVREGWHAVLEEIEHDAN